MASRASLRTSIRLFILIPVAAVLVFATALSAAAPVRAGEAQQLLAASAGQAAVTLSRGSDSGTICWVMAVAPPDAPGQSYDVMTLERTTGQHLVAFDRLVGCETLDPAVITDIFSNPSDYFLVVTVHDVFDDSLCGGPPNCGESFSPFAPAGSACEAFVEQLDPGSSRVTVIANVPFHLNGWRFIPSSDVSLVFSPDYAPEQAGSITLSADELTMFSHQFAPTADQIGAWTVTVTGKGGCSSVVLLEVGSPTAGSTFPGGAVPFPMAARAALPNTATGAHSLVHIAPATVRLALAWLVALSGEDGRTWPTTDFVKWLRDEWRASASVDTPAATDARDEAA